MTKARPPTHKAGDRLKLLREALLAGILLFTLVIVVFTLPTLSFNTRSMSVQERVHKYLYDQQPQQLGEFVKFAAEQMSDATPAEITAALEAEGDLQAGKGHATAVGVLSMMAISYYDAHGLPYSAETWQKRQNKAFDLARVSNVRLSDLWPAK
ncbi:MAG: hypothetical protein HZB53_04420 [Chloroflexi bacterium]|nr:hypothetical protein [Chloroflexota bacterium]